MIIIKGKGVFSAVGIGKILFITKRDTEIKHKKSENFELERTRFKEAKASALKQLAELYEKALKEVGEEHAEIFEIHQMLLEDEDYNASVNELIELAQFTAEYAVRLASDRFAAMFSSMDDEYMKARASDIKDVSDRIIDNLLGRVSKLEDTDGRYIIFADDLTPSETVMLDKRKVLGFVTRFGSSNSHTSILARNMNIPAVIGAEGIDEAMNGKTAAVNGFTGTVYIDPDQETLKMISELAEAINKKKQLLEDLRGKENVTLDGTKIKLYANIGSPEDVESVLKNDADGIGLFRSEFLYLESDDFPSEETQFNAYKKVLESMGTKKVIIRTMDIGADKQIDYFGLSKEENPALGFRAIRICLAYPEIFRTQLRALLRASVYGNLGIMFPMITTFDEILEIKGIVNDVKSALYSEGIAYSDSIEYGIMIETPAAAIMSDVLVPEVDFFSVGTNDLIQYTLAADRQNPKLESFCDTHYEAVLRLIEYATSCAHKYGKWIGICGELGADTRLTERWLKMGIDELSVSPPFVLTVRDKIRKINLKH